MSPLFSFSSTSDASSGSSDHGEHIGNNLECEDFSRVLEREASTERLCTASNIEEGRFCSSPSFDNPVSFETDSHFCLIEEENAQLVKKLMESFHLLADWEIPLSQEEQCHFCHEIGCACPFS